MKKLGKAKAYVIAITLTFVMFLVVVGLRFLDKHDGLPIGAFLTAIVSMTTAYIGVEMANNGVRGKYFNDGVRKVDEEQ